MFRKITILFIIFIFLASFSYAGGWDKTKGFDKITIEGELVCIGCSLKKLNGANAQCNLYAHHAIGFKAKDSTLWSIVDNADGHDVIRAHKLLGKKNATITGWIYPIAHFIGIDAIKVQGITREEIEKAGLKGDMLIANSLRDRHVAGKMPAGHKH